MGLEKEYGMSRCIKILTNVSVELPGNHGIKKYRPNIMDMEGSLFLNETCSHKTKTKSQEILDGF